MIFTENQLKVLQFLVQVYESELKFTNNPMIQKATGIGEDGIKKILKSLRDRNIIQTQRQRVLGGVFGFLIRMDQETLIQLRLMYDI